ncbi:hypothetical protein ACI01nite_12370 [Acetobacter cibinongensis]|uniref:Uncharacterized protein n=1 Tax=Acetobacter cibinongensis TaxID=146475 RepID=A0A0D6N4E0_9PROT|nr:hypothetical protein [Acetobacter cibinongensis]GAN60867.1 hypothetical protein Abci_017_051 [Acetobacter cibinongensis]GBQ13396.1 hypothetical protein AA0482_0580 [Acetobacter cibinongensis NRIC 0482]GEL58635.1 hypothetical protein ACI01nite_12370 [Acetobacter cibinongensis]
MKRLFVTSVSARGRMAALCLPALAVGLAFAQPAQAQELSSREALSLQNEVLALKQQLSQLQVSGNTGGALAPPSAMPATSSSGANGDLTAQLLERVNTLEQQQRDMRGEIDQLTNDLQKQTASLSKQLSDAQFAMQNGGGAAAAPAASAATSAASKKDGEAPKATTPDALLAAGKTALQQKDYAAAQENAEGALKNAKGNFKVDAQFLLAQSLAGQKQYRQSAVSYYDAYRQAPKSARAPDALLGVSASLLALGDKKAACQALGKLKTEFPSPTQRVSHAAEIYATRGGCS